jgi:hypothetical protein
MRKTLTVLYTAVALGSAGAMWFGGAGTALAPEPARLTQDLSGSMGATAAAVYVNTNTQTKVIRWYADWTSTDATVRAAGEGAPCATSDMYSGQQTSKVLHLVFGGTKAKCR